MTQAVSKLLARRLPLEAATDAMTMRKAWANAIARLMDRYDLILTPTLPVTAFEAEGKVLRSIDGRSVGADEWCPFTFPFNLTGQPAASIACGMVNGLPVGLQIVGPHLGDALVLTAAATFERTTTVATPPFSLVI